MKLYDFYPLFVLLYLEAIHMLKNQNLVFRLIVELPSLFKNKKVNVKSFSFVEQTLTS